VLLAERIGMQFTEFNYWGKSEDKDSHVGTIGHAYLEHNLTLADIRLWFEQQAIKVGCTIETWLDYFDLNATWKTERVAIQLSLQAPIEEIAIAPDGNFGLKTEKGRGHCFLEFDRGTETIGKQWKRKVLAYKEYLRSGKFHQRYGVDIRIGFRVLTIASSTRRAENLHRAAARFGHSAFASIFMFTGWPELQKGRLNDAVWLRGGFTEKQRVL